MDGQGGPIDVEMGLYHHLFYGKMLVRAPLGASFISMLSRMIEQSLVCWYTMLTL